MGRTVPEPRGKRFGRTIPAGGASIGGFTFLLATPVLTWTSPGTDTTPEFTADLLLPVVGDIITLTWASDVGFTSILGTSNNTVDAGEAAALLVNFVTGVLSNGTYYFRCKHTRDGSSSAWSNTVTVTIAANNFTYYIYGF